MAGFVELHLLDHCLGGAVCGREAAKVAFQVGFYLTLGFRNDACSAQYIAHCTRTHKSTISRAVTALMKRQMVERVENADDRREFRLRLTRKGKTLYEELIPRLLRKEQEILSCLSAPERKQLALLLGKVEKSLDLVQTSQEADAKEAY